jgi:hypothetical protein
MADHFRGEYVASECPTLFNVISDPEHHKSSQVIRFEMHQVPDIMNPIVIKKQWADSAEYMREHPHESAMQARKCKTGNHCPNLVRLCKDPRMELGQYGLRLAPVFLCHRMWKYDPVKKMMTCRVPLRCFYATIDSFAARKLLTANDDINKNRIRATDKKDVNPSGSISEDLLNLYENRMEKLPVPPQGGLRGIIPLTLLAQSASLVVELAQFSPMLMPGQAERIAKQPKETRLGLCRDISFYGDGCNDGELTHGISIYNTPNNAIYYNLPSPMNHMEINRFPTLEVPNCLSWLLLRNLYKFGPMGVGTNPLFRRYLYEEREQAALSRYIAQYKKLVAQNATAAAVATLGYPALTLPGMSTPVTPHPPGLFDVIDTTSDDSSSTCSSSSDGSSSSLDASNGDRSVSPVAVVVPMSTDSYASVAKTPLPKVHSISSRVQNTLNYMAMYAAYRPLNIKRFATIVSQMPRFKHPGDSRRNAKGTAVDIDEKRITVKGEIKSTFPPESRTRIETEYTRVVLTSNCSYWVVSSATLCISPDMWKSYYGKATPLPTSDSVGKCPCGDEQCYPSNFMGFEEGVEYARKRRDTW